MTDTPPRPPKKSEMLEVRLDYETKRSFLDACRRAGRTASDVVRESVLFFIDRESARPDVQPEPGKLLTMIPRPIRRKRYLAITAGVAGAAGIAMFAALPSAADMDSTAVFHRIDRNGDGVLTPDEFFDGALQPSALVETRKELREGKPAADPDAMRVYNEAYAVLYPRAEGDPRGEWGYELQFQGRVENAPADFDAANFDFLAKADVNPFAAAFIEMDADGNDIISSAEFETWFNRLLVNSFNRMDRDRDGYLAEVEFLRSAGWLRAESNDGTPGDAMPDERMSGGFRKLDKDGDGRLTVAEYIIK